MNRQYQAFCGIGRLFSLAPGSDAVSTRQCAADRPVPDGSNRTPFDDWPSVRAELAGAIVASATPYREDRLFPGDLEQFTPGGGLNLAYGAAGVLYALWATGAGRYPGYEDWLMRRALRPASGTGIGLGLYNGLHGVAHALDRLGRRPQALEVLDICGRERWDTLGLDLTGGLAGIGLSLLHFADVTGDSDLLAAAWRAVDLVADRIGGVDPVPEMIGGDDPSTGLLHGSTGPALLLLRCYERGGDVHLLDLAATALRDDLRRCIRRADREPHVNEDPHPVAHLSQGSVGIGVVLDQYLSHRRDPDLVRASEAISRVADSPFFAQAGLYAGRAGIILYLAHRRRCDPGARAQLGEQVRRLAWHALPFAGHVAFQGDQLPRLSMDLATGTAGVLLGLGAALHDTPVDLPLLAPGVQRRPGDGTVASGAPSAGQRTVQ